MSLTTESFISGGRLTYASRVGYGWRIDEMGLFTAMHRGWHVVHHASDGTIVIDRVRAALVPALVWACLFAWSASGVEAVCAQDIAALPEWTVGARPTVSIGGADGRPDYVLDRVAGATRLSDGRIVVALAAGSVRYFSPTGPHLRSVGRRGRGPGEYEAIHQLFRLPADTVLVVARLPGLTWLGPDGDYVRSLTISLRGGARHPCRSSEGHPFQWLGDGRLVTGLDAGFGTAACPEDQQAASYRRTTLVEIQDHVHERFDTVVVLPGTERTGWNHRVFGAQTLIAAGSGRVFAADSRTSSIQVFEGTRHIATWETPLRAVRVSREARRERLERRRYSDGREENVEFDYPDTYPVMGRLVVDATGALWVMRYPPRTRPLYSPSLTSASNGFQVEDGGARWIVHDTSGSAVARVDTPDRFFPIEIGQDYILGVSQDRLGVQAVELLSLERR